MSKCKSKRAYYTEEMAIEALVQTHIVFENSTAASVYQCEDCGEWHLTSRGPEHEKLKEAKIDGRIKREREAKYWNNQFRH